MNTLHIYRDEGHGITRTSLAFWDQNKHQVGRIMRVVVADVIERVTSPAGYASEYSMIIYGSTGMIILSGCNCGYGGEGPNGTAKILVELGMSVDEARRMMYEKRIDYRLGCLPKPVGVPC